MSASKRKQQRRSGYRQPPRPNSKPDRALDRRPEPQRGFLGGLLGNATPASLSAMPSYRVSLGRGFLLAGSTPVLVMLPLAWVLIVWIALLLLGYVGSPGVLIQALAIPPISVGFDLQTSVGVFGQPTGLYLAVPFLVVRAVLVAVLAGFTVEAFERAGRVSLDGVRRGLRAAPVVLASVVLGVMTVFLTQLAGFFGVGLAALFSVVIPTVGLWILSFVPFIAVRGRPSLPVVLTRAYVGARTPGGRQFVFCLLYLLLLTVLQFVVPATRVTANPGLGTWIGVLLITYFHMGFFAALAFRWLSIERSV